MQIKQIFATPPGWVKLLNARQEDGTLLVPGKPENELLNAPPLAGVELCHTGKSAAQNFSEDLVARNLQAGIMSFADDGALIFNVSRDGSKVDLRYTVKRKPGSYCLHCGENLNDTTVNDGAPSRAHVAAKHPDAAPIPGSPAGYERIHAYECQLDADQHAAYCFAQWDAKRKGRA